MRNPSRVSAVQRTGGAPSLELERDRILELGRRGAGRGRREGGRAAHGGDGGAVERRVAGGPGHVGVDDLARRREAEGDDGRAAPAARGRLVARKAGADVRGVGEEGAGGGGGLGGTGAVAGHSPRRDAALRGVVPGLLLALLLLAFLPVALLLLPLDPLFLLPALGVADLLGARQLLGLIQAVVGDGPSLGLLGRLLGDGGAAVVGGRHRRRRGFGLFGRRALLFGLFAGGLRRGRAGHGGGGLGRWRRGGVLRLLRRF